MSATNIIKLKQVWVGEGAPADGDQLSLNTSQYPINSRYTDSETGISYIRNAANSVAADWQSGGTPILSATVELTDAQIKALPTTAIEIIAAPGSGRAILPIWGVVSFFHVANYTNIQSDSIVGTFYDTSFQDFLTLINEDGNGGVSALLALSESVSMVMIPSVQLYQLTSAGVRKVHPKTDAFIHSGIINQSIKILATNSGGNFTGGNSANSLKVTVYYVIVDL